MVQRKKLKNKRRPNIDFIIGVEIEIGYNKDKLPNLNIGGYHSGRVNKFNKNFNCERDGSLRNSRSLRWRTCEFISNPFLASDYKKVMNSFKKTIIRKSRDTEFNNVLYLNKSMGAHVHVTPLFVKNKQKTDVYYKGKDKGYNRRKKILFSAIITDDFVTKFRKVMRKNVKTALPELYGDWSRHLNRRYSKFRTIEESRQKRFSEWNFSHDRKHRLEYRSFNLLGVKTWEEFETMYECFFNALFEAFNDELDYNKPFHSEHKFNFKSEPIDTRHICKIVRSTTIERESDRNIVRGTSVNRNGLRIRPQERAIDSLRTMMFNSLSNESHRREE